MTNIDHVETLFAQRWLGVEVSLSSEGDLRTSENATRRNSTKSEVHDMKCGSIDFSSYYYSSVSRYCLLYTCSISFSQVSSLVGPAYSPCATNV